MNPRPNSWWTTCLMDDSIFSFSLCRWSRMRSTPCRFLTTTFSSRYRKITLWQHATTCLRTNSEESTFCCWKKGIACASSLATVVQMVANGYGLTILPSLALSTEVGEPGPIAVIPFAEPVPYRSIGLAWRQSTPHEDEFKELGHFIRQLYLQGVEPLDEL